MKGRIKFFARKEETVSKKSYVITIDGHRGTGKSRLARSLREYFGFGVLEIGPVFRLLAWLIKEGYAQTPQQACDVLQQLIEGGQIVVNEQLGGELSSCRIEFKGKSIDEDLWSPRLDDLLRDVAGTPDVVDRVAGIVRWLADRKDLIIIGREAGAKMFPEAKAKILLQAGNQARRERKITQLTQNVPEVSQRYEIEDSEPGIDWERADDTFIIDTTDVPASSVFDQAASYIKARIGRIDSDE